MAMVLNLNNFDDERDDIEENYDALADNPEHVAEGFQNSDANSIDMEESDVETNPVNQIPEDTNERDPYIDGDESHEVETNYQSFEENPVDIADDVQERMINTLGTTDKDGDVTEDEILYGGDENDYQYQYYDNADEFQTYDEQEIAYHDDMDGQ